MHKMQNKSLTQTPKHIEDMDKKDNKVADDSCVVGVKIKSWSHFFADRAAKCLKDGLLDDSLRFVDLALLEKYLEVLRQITEKVEGKRDRLLSKATFHERCLSQNEERESIKAKL